ncbi:TolC family protein [Crocinitomix catalasitica]|uniref:TolC family protein n=1 Tax=Crocinitomix catalasitica TaxID=184607 RepID=UPI00146F9E40|nr:TolC family protein [Crocinitomix catalasitica]
MFKKNLLPTFFVLLAIISSCRTNNESSESATLPSLNVDVYIISSNKFDNEAIKNAEFANGNAMLTTENVKLDLKAQILTLYQNFLSAQNRLILAQENEVTMQSVYRVTAEQFKEGQISGYDFRLMQNALLQTSIQVTELNYLLQVIRLNLDRLSGEVMNKYI